MLRVLTIACLIGFGAAPSAHAGLTDAEFQLAIGYMNLRLSMGDVAEWEARWVQKHLNKYYTKYHGRQDEECWVYSYRMNFPQCRYDCDCAGRATYQMMAPHFKRYGITTPYDGGGR